MKEVRMRAEAVRAPGTTKTIERGIIGSLIVDPVMLRVNFVGLLIAHAIYGIGLGLTAPWANHAPA
jgi:hypothetical protein